jgi:hypothetical protein
MASGKTNQGTNSIHEDVNMDLRPRWVLASRILMVDWVEIPRKLRSSRDLTGGIDGLSETPPFRLESSPPLRFIQL